MPSTQFTKMIQDICIEHGWCIAECRGHKDGLWQLCVYQEDQKGLKNDEHAWIRVGILSFLNEPQKYLSDSSDLEILAAKAATSFLFHENPAEYDRILKKTIEFVATSGQQPK